MTLHDVLALYQLDLDQEVISHRCQFSREAIETTGLSGDQEHRTYTPGPLINVVLSFDLLAPRGENR